jgi:cell division protein FtsB
MNKVTLKQQLQDELTRLRQRVADLEAQESKLGQGATFIVELPVR